MDNIANRASQKENIIKPSPLSLIPKPPASDPGQLPCPAETVRTALATILASRHFAKAYRCNMLLGYLIERALAGGDAASPPEQEIGVAVFSRDPESYFPADDPIVRVQAGRLRLRLAAYYEDEGAADLLRITVPVGRYQARIALAERRAAVRPGGPVPLLVFRPLVALGVDLPAAGLAAALSDELEFRLYRALPNFRLVGPSRAAALPPPGQVLEGTLRQDAARLRLSLRLRDGETGALLWCEQFDDAGDPTIAGQEQLAGRCVQALQAHLLG